MKDEVTLEGFCAGLISHVISFKEHYRKERMESDGDEETWPLEMGSGDWFEQFLLYLAVQTGGV